MANIYYLSSSGVSDYVLNDANNKIVNIEFPSIDRAYTVVDLFSDGAIITGNGAIKAGQITFSQRFFQDYYIDGVKYNATTTWNNFRYAIMTFIGLAKYQPIYFNILDSNGSSLRQRIYPVSKGSESYSMLGISEEVSFSFQMEKAYFYNTVANSSTYSVISSAQEIFSVTNNGVLPVAPMFTYTPTDTVTSIQIQLYYGNYGFKLAATFTAGQPVTFDCATGITTQNGNVVTGIQSDGSIFNIPPGTVQLYITAGAGTLLTSFNERYF